jgi:hypothetical protein
MVIINNIMNTLVSSLPLQLPNMNAAAMNREAMNPSNNAWMKTRAVVPNTSTAPSNPSNNGGVAQAAAAAAAAAAPTTWMPNFMVRLLGTLPTTSQ